MSSWKEKLSCKGCAPDNSRTYRVLHFLLLATLDASDFASDWLLCVDVTLAEKGLVYGPPEKSAIIALYVFSVIGTFTYAFELTNLWWETFRNNAWLDTDLVSAMTIWVEDLPQIAINVYIALCREDPVSVFQLMKASIVIIELLIRFTITLVKYCNKADLLEMKNFRNKDSNWKRHMVYRVLIIVGLVVNAACAATVFVFTQTQRDMEGNVIFQVPETLFEDKYNDQRYFQNVSIFLYHPDFVSDVSGSPQGENGYVGNWIRFMSINDIRNRENLEITYNFAYEKTDTHLKLGFWKKLDEVGENYVSGNWKLQECYSMEFGTGKFYHVDEYTCENSFFQDPTSILITFAFFPPRQVFRKRIFGDIRFNAVVIHHGKLEAVQKMDLTNDIKDNVSLPAVRYFRTNPFLKSSTTHLLTTGSTTRFFWNNGVDLTDIKDVWRTGWGRCESSGSLAPHMDKEIPTYLEISHEHVSKLIN